MFVHGDSPYLREVPAPSDQAAQSGVQMLPGETALTLWLPNPSDSARTCCVLQLHCAAAVETQRSCDRLTAATLNAGRAPRAAVS